MKAELNNIFINESEALEELLKVLENQYNYLIENNVFELEKCIEHLKVCSRKVAEWEVKRRNLIKEESLNKLVYSVGDEGLENNYRKIKMLIQEAIVQKDMNQLLIQQGLGYTNRMLSILNPDRKSKTYNSYGKVFK